MVYFISQMGDSIMASFIMMIFMAMEKCIKEIIDWHIKEISRKVLSMVMVFFTMIYLKKSHQHLILISQFIWIKQDLIGFYIREISRMIRKMENVKYYLPMERSSTAIFPIIQQRDMDGISGKICHILMDCGKTMFLLKLRDKA